MTFTAQHISVSINGRAILRDVGLRAVPGQIVGLIGPNGAGKSTFLRVLAGLLKPDRGVVMFDDTDVTVMPAESRAQNLAYVPQDHSVHWPVKVYDLVALGRLPFRRAWSVMDQDDRKAVQSALEKMELADLVQRSALSLSGGELARVLIARALAQTPRVLLADEPTAGLDPAHQLRLLDLLRQSGHEGMTTVIVLHDLSLAARFCDHLVLLNEGAVYRAGQPTDVLTDRVLRDVYGVKSLIMETADGLNITPVGVVDR